MSCAARCASARSTPSNCLTSTAPSPPSPAVIPTSRCACEPSPPGAELLTALDADDLDLALAPAPCGLPTSYAARTLFSEQLVVITAVQHRLSRAGSVALTELRDETFVSFPPGTGLRRILDEAAYAADFTPKVPFETTSLTRMSRLRNAPAHGSSCTATCNPWSSGRCRMPGFDALPAPASARGSSVPIADQPCERC